MLSLKSIYTKISNFFPKYEMIDEVSISRISKNSLRTFRNLKDNGLYFSFHDDYGNDWPIREKNFSAFLSNIKKILKQYESTGSIKSVEREFFGLYIDLDYTYYPYVDAGGLKIRIASSTPNSFVIDESHIRLMVDKFSQIGR